MQRRKASVLPPLHSMQSSVEKLTLSPPSFSWSEEKPAFYPHFTSVQNSVDWR